MNQTQSEICAKRLKECREQYNYTLEEIGNKIGVHKSTILRWEKGETGKIKQPVIQALADLYQVNIHWLMGESSTKTISYQTSKKGVKIPVLGSVAAGIPIDAIQDIVDYEEIDQELAKKGDFFGLQVKGQSMFPYIIDTDVIIVRKQEDCESGQIAVVLVNGDEATVKKVIKNEDSITLIPYNTAAGFLPVTFTKEEIETKPVKIIGIVAELRRKNFNT